MVSINHEGMRGVIGNIVFYTMNGKNYARSLFDGNYFFKLSIRPELQKINSFTTNALILVYCRLKITEPLNWQLELINSNSFIIIQNEFNKCKVTKCAGKQS